MATKSIIQRVRALARASVRRETGLFVVEGPRSVEDVLSKSPQAIETLYATQAWFDQQVNIASGAEIVSQRELERMSAHKAPQGVLAIVHQPASLSPQTIGAGRYLCLDNIQVPGNVGTLIRTAHWYGLDGVLLGPECADPFAAKTVQASMASVMSVPLLKLSSYKDIIDFGLPVIAADAKGSYRVDPLDSFILAIGQEGRGLDKTLLEQADHVIAIERFGDAESLNAAVAGAVLLSQLRA